MAMTTKQAAEKWGISDRRVRTLCVNGQIDGAWREGKLWFVPDNAPKPADGRIRGKETLLAQIERKKKELGEDGFEAWNAKFWSELDKGTSPYFSAKGD